MVVEHRSAVSSWIPFLHRVCLRIKKKEKKEKKDLKQQHLTIQDPLHALAHIHWPKGFCISHNAAQKMAREQYRLQNFLRDGYQSVKHRH